MSSNYSKKLLHFRKIKQQRMEREGAKKKMEELFFAKYVTKKTAHE